MRYLLLGCLLGLLVGCGGPRQFTKIHFLSVNDTNQGRALPLHVIPVDGSLRVKLDSMSAEDWFVSEDAENLTGIQKRVLRGAQNEVVQMERRDQKNDFMVIVDFAEVNGADQQKVFIGDRFYRAKDVFVIVLRDRVRVVEKSVFDDYMRSN